MGGVSSKTTQIAVPGVAAAILEPRHQWRDTTLQQLATNWAMQTTSCDGLRVALWAVGHAPAIFRQQRCRRLKIDDSRSVRKRRLVTLAAASLVLWHHDGCFAVYLAHGMVPHDYKK